ncbi:DUF2514 family protein [Paenalcaligenes hominis]|uniref:DUF2514 family protein n=1 Tax=Paenalcaligenes hominis TaxID=643674 RepID=UPI0035245E67
MLKQVGIGAAMTAALFFCGWLYGQAQYKSGYKMAHKDQAVLIAQAYERVRDIELKRQAEMEVIRNDALLQIEQIEMDRDSADATSERLRKELARYRADTANACAATGSPSAQDPIGVLIGLLEGLESAGREIAEYADRARVAGMACERVYDSVRMIN